MCAVSGSESRSSRLRSANRQRTRPKKQGLERAVHLRSISCSPRSDPATAALALASAPPPAGRAPPAGTSASRVPCSTRCSSAESWGGIRAQGIREHKQAWLHSHTQTRGQAWHLHRGSALACRWIWVSSGGFQNATVRAGSQRHARVARGLHASELKKKVKSSASFARVRI